MAAIQSVRVSERSKKREKSPEQTDPTKVSAPLPDNKLYGIYGPQYAAALAAKTGSTGADILNRGTLQARADAEAAAYSRELEASSLAAAQMQDKAAYYGILSDNGDNLQGDVELGMGGVRGKPVWNEQYGVWEAPTDALRVAVANGNVLNNDQAARFEKQAGAIKTLGEAGYGFSNETVGQIVTPPTQKEPMVVTPYMTPKDATDRYAADQGLTAEQQFELARINAEAKANGDDVEGKVIIGANGVAQVEYKGSPQALQKYGIGPDGRPLNPKAGAVDGAVPATPAVEQKAPKVTSAIRPVRDGRNAVNSVYPQYANNVTQVERDPNSALGKANPTSWHTRSKAAIDMRPIKGMTFEQYVDGYRKAGYEIIEAKDEVKHPSKHATGPHWHVVLGENKAGRVFQNRLANHPAVAKSVPMDDGTILVTLKNGRQVVYDRQGKRIG